MNNTNKITIGITAALAGIAGFGLAFLWIKSTTTKDPSTTSPSLKQPNASLDSTYRCQLATPDPTTTQGWLHLCTTRMKKCIPPRQSMFRVYAILTWKNDASNMTGWVSGTNSESAYIGGSLCAERAAAVQLRELPPTCRVTAVYLCSDLLETPITPGVLCREYLLSCVASDVPIWLTTANNSVTRQTSLLELYPYPSLFEGIARNNIIARGKACCQRITSMDCNIKKFNNQWSTLITNASEASLFDVLGGSMHPVKYGSAMEFEDGEIVCGWQKAGLEYGTTIDAVTSLLHRMDEKSPIRPIRLVVVDQFGNLHAPVAPARAQLYERDNGGLKVAVDNTDTGQRCEVDLASLVPDCPKMSEIW
tara:strand:- start:374 stop:1465 length:1092 start_codon:yes stop_codon:yes gene_type:complete